MFTWTQGLPQARDVSLAHWLRASSLVCALLLAAGCAGRSPRPAGQQTPQGVKPLRLPPGVSPEDLADPAAAEKTARWIEAEHPSPRPEGAQMLLEILRGTWMTGQGGWFKPASTRYTWTWLCERVGLGPEAREIQRAKLAGAPELFDALDRDGDGSLSPEDLDWSDQSPYVEEASVLNRLFRRLDESGDGTLERDELLRFFDTAARGADRLTARDLRDFAIPRGPQGFSPGNAPTVPLLVRALFNGELGSLAEGPALNEPAPGFELRTVDGARAVSLGSLLGARPVVLVFGNFTCGPFRGLFPDVAAVHRRFKDRAEFLLVYVREAHPEDGWKMESNTRVGISVSQPRSLAERAAVCARFADLLKPEIPVVVDDIDDPAGTAYSAMPARLYVLDRKGRVAYKSGRGPFGFKPGELEQALVLSLLEES